MKIAIIGSGGAGMSAAWMLDEEHEVTLFERNPTIGGHAHTVEVERDGHLHHIDDGFNWFSDRMYPRYMALLDHLQIGMRPVNMTMAFLDTRTGYELNMPPVGIGKILALLASPRRLRTLLQLNSAVGLAQRIVDEHDTSISGHEFIQRLGGSQDFNQNFLIPVMSGTWGCPHERTLDMAVYPLMKYIVLHKPSALGYFEWHVVEGGANAYIRKVAAALSERSTILVDNPVTAIERSPEGVQIVDNEGETHLFDHVIFACGGSDAAKILENTQTLTAQRDAARRFEYYTAHVATHCDPRWMPRDRKYWSVVNIRYTGDQADATIWDGMRFGTDVFDTYVRDDDMPNEVHHVSAFRLPLETPDFFAAQAHLGTIQGQDSVWFAGDYTQDIGSHEDAVNSSVDVVAKISPSSSRYRFLAEIPAAAKAKYPGARN